MKASTWTAVVIAATVLAGIGALLMFWGLIHGGQATLASEVISCSTVFMLAVTSMQTGRQLYTRQSALEQWGESLGERKKFLDLRERSLNQREKDLSYWEMIKR